MIATLLADAQVAIFVVTAVRLRLMFHRLVTAWIIADTMYLRMISGAKSTTQPSTTMSDLAVVLLACQSKLFIVSI